MIKVDQVRRVIETIYYRPSDARERVYIFNRFGVHERGGEFSIEGTGGTAGVRHDFSSLRKPGRTAADDPVAIHGFSPGCAAGRGSGAIPRRTSSEWKPQQRALVARLSEGALGRARSFDVELTWLPALDALTILNSALLGGEHTALFKITETYRAGAEGRDKTEQLLRTLYSLLRDLMFLSSGAQELVHNTDIQGQLTKLVEAADFEWIVTASDRLAEVERGMRRNLLRSLSLDALELAVGEGLRSSVDRGRVQMLQPEHFKMAKSCGA